MVRPTKARRYFRLTAPACCLITGVCCLAGLSVVAAAPLAATNVAPHLHTVGGKHDITVIQLTGVYYLPAGRQPIPDWRERIAYFLDRAAKFHAREFTGQSHVVWEVRATVYTPTPEKEPPKDVNDWFWQVANEVRQHAWHRAATGFPILLIFTDTNYCPGYNEWTRQCDPARCICTPHDKGCDGYVTASGEERPGSKCGGSRAVYWPEENMGLGVISGDGWRVPIKGSDCVAYHEGIGHSIGLPHPEPIDNSVMGLAQYHTTLDTAVIDADQKRSLGWQAAPLERTSLFSNFSIDYTPLRPQVGQPITLMATFTKDKVPYAATAQYQTAFGAWTTLGSLHRRALKDNPKLVQLEWALPAFEQPTAVSYRILVSGGLGEREQQWDFLRVHDKQR